ncbi:chemotaxis response regulator protein-glutamate methylesterase [soil metagenome]
MRAASTRKIKVLVVDDSAMVRKILSEAIGGEDDMELVGTAPDPYVAREKILALRPDVITLDIEMPRMDGITFLKELMAHSPVPTIIISSQGQASCATALEALRCGAVDVMAKPAGPYSVGDLRLHLAAKIRSAAISTPRVIHERRTSPASEQRLVDGKALTSHSEVVIAIGASTGGTVAIQEILLQLPADIPGIVITQHIPAAFSSAFAKRLDSLCGLSVKEAVTGDLVRPGCVLIAPGDQHLVLRRAGVGYAVELQRGPRICYQRPSVDVMFASVAQVAGPLAVGVLLTGMGADGARGLLALKKAGAHTVAQDEASCVVYGMPREAVLLGAVGTVASLADIPKILLDVISERGPLDRSLVRTRMDH